MNGAELLAAAVGGLLFALINALHCAGMCGAFAVRAAAGRRAGAGVSAYLLGKTFTYVFLGALAGAAGGRLLAAASPLQRFAGLLVGALFVLAGLRLLAGRTASGATGRLARAAGALLAPLLADLRLADAEATPRDATAADAPLRGDSGLAAGGAQPQARAAARRFSFGALTGLLPCGVSGLALLQAAALGSPASGAAFMAAFGLGTAPALVAAALLGRGLLARAGAGTRRLRLAAGGLLLAAGLLALLRAGAGWNDLAPAADGSPSHTAAVFACPLCPR